MRIKLIARLVVAALGAAFVVASPSGFGVAHADSTIGLGTDTHWQMVVDSAHGQLFFSPGLNRSDVRVTDLSGGLRTTIRNLPDASGMALSTDGSTLYVALPRAGAIAAIATTTLTETHRYSLGSSTCPTWLTPAGGKLYFGYGCTFGKGKLGSLDLRGGTPAVALDLPLDDTFAEPPLLGSSPGDPDLLLVVDRSTASSSTSGTPILYDVSSGTPSKVAALPWDTCTGLNDAALTPDASKVILACDFLGDRSVAATRHAAFSTTDLSAAGGYPSGVWPKAVTTAPNGSFVVVGSTSTIYVERPDGTLVHRYDLPQGSYLERQGLAVSADSRTVYAVAADQNGGRRLHLLTDFAKAASSLTLSAPPTSARAAKLTVSGQLTIPGATMPRTLRVVKNDLAGTQPLPDVTTTATGAFSFSDTPPVGGPNTYTVTLPGDAAHLGSSRSITVEVSRAYTAMRVTTNASIYGYGRSAMVTAQLGTTYNSRRVCLYALPFGAARTTLKCGTVDSSGKLTVSYPMYRRTMFIASFAGDHRYAPARAFRTANVSQ
ncbi:hypothetical protein NCC78_05225 [Micromonospora phytophila]|uniref:hypothetical protein n=1 Tax=Micromonospora phytophila TaxID=709888 RepID=UPI00202F4C90|nr:hypothetical protein [Micromonospora phytophila]MCM0674104.1 hypothetical protein [Micromonospora phytophila]